MKSLSRFCVKGGNAWHKICTDPAINKTSQKFVNLDTI